MGGPANWDAEIRHDTSRQQWFLLLDGPCVCAVIRPDSPRLEPVVLRDIASRASAPRGWWIGAALGLIGALALLLRPGNRRVPAAAAAGPYRAIETGDGAAAAPTRDTAASHEPVPGDGRDRTTRALQALALVALTHAPLVTCLVYGLVI